MPAATVVFLVLVAGLMSTATLAQLEIPCIEFHPRLDFPCLCGLNDINATRINCDGVAFREFPFLPFKFYIQEFQQQHAGLQTLGEFLAKSLSTEWGKMRKKVQFTGKQCILSTIMAKINGF